MIRARNFPRFNFMSTAVQPVTASEGSKAKSRPGGRTERNSQAVAQAVLSELEQGNFQFTITHIADKAGINRSTVYRRWPSRAALITESLKLHTSELQAPDTGSWETDLRALTAILSDFIANPVEISLARTMLSDNDEELKNLTLAHWAPLLDTLCDPIRTAQQRKEISSAIDPLSLLNMVINRILMTVLFVGKPLSENDQEAMITTFLAMTIK